MHHPLQGLMVCNGQTGDLIEIMTKEHVAGHNINLGLHILLMTIVSWPTNTDSWMRLSGKKKR